MDKHSFSSIRKYIYIGSVWAMGGKFLSSFFGILVNAVLARLISPTLMGDYFLVLSIISIGSVAIQLGLNRIVVKLVAESLMGENVGVSVLSLVKKSFSIVFFAFVFFAIVFLLIVSPILSENIMSASLAIEESFLITLWVLFFAHQVLFSEIFRGFEDIPKATLFGGLISLVISWLVYSGLYLYGADINLFHVILTSCLAIFLNNFMAIIFLSKKLGALSSESEYSTSHILQAGFPMLITSLSLIIITQGNIWIAGVFLSKDQVALYGAASRILIVGTLPLIVLNSVIPPIVAREHAKGNLKKLENLFRVFATYAALPGLLVLSAFFVFGGEILGLVFGGFYSDASGVLVILCLGHVINLWAGSCGTVLIMSGNQATMMRITLITGMFGFVAALILVTHYGIIGIAIASAGAIAMQNILMIAFVKKKLDLWTSITVSPSLLVRGLRLK